MNTSFLKKGAVIAAFGFVLAGCAGTPLVQIDRENVVDADGHVIGHRQTLLDERGQEVSRVELYIPLRDPNGELVAYEEQTKGGSIIRDLNGRVIGTRWDDPRGRGSNPGSRGVGMVFPPRQVHTGESTAGGSAAE